MYYNQKQRNRIYKKAYDLVEKGEHLFVCLAIQDVINDKVEVNKHEFPELFIFRDNEEEYCFLTLVDFDVKTDYIREPKMITRKLWVLAFCIAMTE